MTFRIPLVPILKNEANRRHWSWKTKEQKRWLPYLRVVKLDMIETACKYELAVAKNKGGRLNEESAGGQTRGIIQKSWPETLCGGFGAQVKRRLTITVHWGKRGVLPDRAAWIVGLQPVIDLLGTKKPKPYIRRRKIVDPIKLGWIFDDSEEWLELVYNETVRDKKSWTEFSIE